jgi:hypothetical protein
LLLQEGKLRDEPTKFIISIFTNLYLSPAAHPMHTQLKLTYDRGKDCRHPTKEEGAQFKMPPSRPRLTASSSKIIKPSSTLSVTNIEQLLNRIHKKQVPQPDTTKNCYLRESSTCCQQGKQTSTNFTTTVTRTKQVHNYSYG